MSTNFNNNIYSARGCLVGFRCFECGGAFDRMWGNTCNGCRETERRHQEMIAAVRAHNGRAAQMAKDSLLLSVTPSDSAGEKP